MLLALRQVLLLCIQDFQRPYSPTFSDIPDDENGPVVPLGIRPVSPFPQGSRSVCFFSLVVILPLYLLLGKGTRARRKLDVCLRPFHQIVSFIRAHSSLLIKS